MSKSKLTVSAEIAQILSIPLVILGLLLPYLYQPAPATAVQQNPSWFSTLTANASVRLILLAVFLAVLAGTLHLIAAIVNRRSNRVDLAQRTHAGRLGRMKDGLIIHSATYGANGEYFDITPMLRSEIRGNALDVLVSNNLAGDPMPSVRKIASVVYSLNGSSIRHTAQWESERLVIPPVGGRSSVISDLAVANRQIKVFTDGVKSLEERVVAEGRRAIQAEGQLTKKDSDIQALIQKRDEIYAELIEIKRNNRIKDEENKKLEQQLAHVTDSINSRMSEISALQGSVGELSGIRTGLELEVARLKKQIEFRRLVFEETPTIRERLGRMPTLRIQHYPGHSNRSLADKVAAFFQEAKWGQVNPIEVPKTDLVNRETGKRIMLTYRRSDIGTFHEPAALIENGEFFNDEKVTRSINDVQESDLMVTIFSRNHWD